MATKKVSKTLSAHAKTKSAGRQNAARRELIDTGADKRFAHKDVQGKFNESNDVGCSLEQDRKEKAKTVTKAGQGDRTRNTVSDKLVLKFLADTLNSLGTQMVFWSHRLPEITNVSEIEELLGFLARLEGNAAGIHNTINAKVPVDPAVDALVRKLVANAELILMERLDQFVRGQKN